MKKENIVRYSLEELRELKSETDWERLARETGEPDLDEEEIGMVVDWSKAKVVIPAAKASLSLRLDPDIIAFFKSEGKGYQTRINAVLRTYVEARKRQVP